MKNDIQAHILLIDDEPSIAETVIAYARKEHMEVTYRTNGEDGIQAFQREKCDLVILDWMLPGISGPEIIKIIREKSDVPILMVSARDDESDIVIGLELGADDYITKPFGPRELMARIKSLLRRIGNFSHIDTEGISCANLKIFFEKGEIYKKNKLVHLTPNEFRIFKELWNKKGMAVSREELMEKALGYTDFMNDRTLDTHIKNLRHKLEDDSKKTTLILTVREMGFKIAC